MAWQSRGDGGDIFVYRSTDQSNAATRDTIADFADGDHIDLVGCDAATGQLESFNFVGGAGAAVAVGEVSAASRHRRHRLLQ